MSLVFMPGRSLSALLYRSLLTLCLALVSTSALAVLPIQQWQTSSGVNVLFVQADGIPMLDVEVRFDAGDRLDSADKSGLADLTASLLDAGAGDLDEQGIADAFAMLGAQRSSWSSMDSASVRLRSLTSEPELSRALSLVTDMIVRPRFNDQVLAREKQRAVLSIGNALKRPGVQMRRAYVDLSYPDHPYGLLTTIESVNAISADDLRQFHRQHFVQSRAAVAMIGAISREQAAAVAEQLVGELPMGQAGNTLPDVVAPTPTEKLIAHPATQSHIVVGAPLIARGDPDYFPLLVANHVLGGGGFVSRLYKQVREERGLVYSVSSGFSLRSQPGPFSISLQTRREKTGEALGVVRDELNRFAADGITQAELDASTSNLAGGFALSIDSNSKILSLLGAIGYHGLPLDYLETWPGKVRAVTLDQVNDAIKRRIQPDQMLTVVVGETDFKN
ncbi:MAG: M16 family metallopeptidase [Burkholderiaceae bacterium]